MSKLRSATLGSLAILMALSVLAAACAKPVASPTPTASPTTAPTLSPASPSPGPAPTTTSPQAATPSYGGTLKIIAGASLVNLGSPTNVAAPGDLFAVVPAVESLLRVDALGIPVPWLATEWQVSADVKSITFTLRKGVKYHDGTDFNAAAVKEILDKVRTSTLPQLKSVSSIDVIDDSRFRLNLSRYEAHLLNFLAVNQAGWMLSPTAVSSRERSALLAHPVGTGPFKLESYTPNVGLKYQRFDAYWQPGKPYLDGVQFILVGDQTTALLSFQAGEAHVNTLMNQKDGAALRDSGKYDMGLTPANVSGLTGDSANADSPFADVRVRRAVSYAIDTQTVTKSLGHGFLQPANQLFTSRNWAYNPEVVGYPYDPKKAKELLAEAGYANGFKTSIIYNTTDNADFHVAYQNYLSEVGINAQLQPASGALFTKFSTSGWKNALYSTLIPGSAGTDPAYSLIGRFSSQAVQFVSVIRPKDYDDLLIQAVGEPNFDKKKAMFQEVVKLAIDKYAMVTPIYGNTLVSARQKQVRDSKIREEWTTQWTPENAWLSK